MHIACPMHELPYTSTTTQILLNMRSVNSIYLLGNHRFIIHSPPSAYLCSKPNPVLHLSLRFQMRRYEKGIMAQAVANQ